MEGDLVKAIYIGRNPDKLKHLALVWAVIPAMHCSGGALE
jgi:hypothetical protein